MFEGSHPILAPEGRLRVAQGVSLGSSAEMGRAPEGRKDWSKMHAKKYSAAPPGLCPGPVIPRLTPWAIFYRLSEAGFAKSSRNFLKALRLAGTILIWCN